MKKKTLAFSMIALTLASMCAITYKVTLRVLPVVFGDPSSSYREVWVNVSVTNTHENMTTSGDIRVGVSSSVGVDIAWSTNITEYFRNIAYWNGTLGYNTYMDWLNGTSTLPYHWGEMDWYVSEGSLTSITWDEIKYWWDMYSDTGGGANYWTFMGNTYMADCNLTHPTNDPDIIDVVPWDGDKIVIKDLVVPANMSIYLVLKTVITQPGAYIFNLTSPNPLLEISPSSWRVGGVATILVPYDYSTIWEAVNAASAGDTILVYPGTYSTTTGENFPITINIANLTIRSTDGADLTIIGGESSWSPAVHILNNVTLQGFTIKNFKANETYGIGGVLVEGNNSTIRDNVVKNIFNCTKAPAGIGIDVHAKDVQIVNNIVHDVGSIGIRVRDHWKEELQGPTGISNNVLIENNKVYRTNNTGVLVTGYAKGVTIRNNEIYESLEPTPYNVFVHYNSSDVIIENNNIHDTYANVVLAGCDNITISGNNITSATNATVGPSYGKNIYILSDYGAWVDTNLLSTNVTITRNDILNGNYGIRIVNAYAADPTPMVSTTTINYNNITGNSEYGLENKIAGANVDARYNWWGNETGPYHSTLNPNGLGDNVSDNIDFKPWLIQPYPPLVLVSELYVDPQLIQCWTGLNKTFEVKITLANVKLLYGFGFKLKWNTTLLSLTYASYSELWGAYPNTYPWQNTINNTIGEYHLAVSGTGDVPSFNGNATLATLSFNITSEPVYPNNFTSDLALVETLLTSTKNLTEPEPILHVVYNGTYMCNYTLPKIALGQPIYIVERTPRDLETGETKKFDVDINVTNVINLEAFEFNFTYDPSLLKVDKIFVDYTSYYIGVNSGSVFVHVEGISPLVNGTAKLATIKFKVAHGFVWNTVNRSRSCDLAFSYTNLTAPGNTPIEHDAINGTYIYKPVPGDLDLSGEVDILDLSAAAKAFGLKSTDPSWNVYWFADVYVDDVINILDIVLIARNFHRTEPEP